MAALRKAVTASVLCLEWLVSSVRRASGCSSASPRFNGWRPSTLLTRSLPSWSDTGPSPARPLTQFSNFARVPHAGTSASPAAFLPPPRNSTSTSSGPYEKCQPHASLRFWCSEAGLLLEVQDAAGPGLVVEEHVGNLTDDLTGKSQRRGDAEVVMLPPGIRGGRREIRLWTDCVSGAAAVVVDDAKY